MAGLDLNAPLEEEADAWLDLNIPVVQLGIEHAVEAPVEDDDDDASLPALDDEDDGFVDGDDN